VIHFDASSPAPAALFERVLGERIDQDTLRWLIDGFRKFDQHEGALPLERCLRLPTAAQRRLAERDFWLRVAGALIIEPRPVLRATELADRLQVFMSRGPWLQWRALSEPPEAATDLQRALFHVARAIGDRPLPQWRQVMRVLGVVTETPSVDNAKHLLSSL
jgi:hypothetical protein